MKQQELLLPLVKIKILVFKNFLIIYKMNKLTFGISPKGLTIIP
jgi:hypothetical protein